MDLKDLLDHQDSAAIQDHKETEVNQVPQDRWDPLETLAHPDRLVHLEQQDHKVNADHKGRPVP